jgi:multiple sugar transport system permease protein
MTYGGPGVATSVLGFYTYLKGFKFFDVGYTAALGIILVFMISVLAHWIIKTMANSRHRA